MIRPAANCSAAPSDGSLPRYESEMMRIVPALSSRLIMIQTKSTTSPNPIVAAMWVCTQFAAPRGLESARVAKYTTTTAGAEISTKLRRMNRPKWRRKILKLPSRISPSCIGLTLELPVLEVMGRSLRG